MVQSCPFCNAVNTHVGECPRIKQPLVTLYITDTERKPLRLVYEGAAVRRKEDIGGGCVVVLDVHYRGDTPPFPLSTECEVHLHGFDGSLPDDLFLGERLPDPSGYGMRMPRRKRWFRVTVEEVNDP